jgi:hypothetical protein
MAKRIKKNNLLPWFTEDHGRLPVAYLRSCQKFFDGLGRASNKQVDKQSASAYIGNSKKEYVNKRSR